MNARIKKLLVLAIVGIAVNCALAGIKMYVGLSTNSLTVMLDGANSTLDIATCVVTAAAFAMLYFGKKANGALGYGRGEYLASFVVAIATLVMGGLFFIRSLNRMAMPEPVWFGWESCVLISVCIPIKLAVAVLYQVANKKLCSKAISALTLDSFLDVGITATSLISFTVSARVNYAVDAIIGIALSIAVIAMGVKMIASSVKATVVGDDTQSLREQICEELTEKGFRTGEILVHDYGYGMTVGTAEVFFEDDTIAAAESALDECKADIEQKTGVKLQFVLRSKTKES